MNPRWTLAAALTAFAFTAFTAVPMGLCCLPSGDSVDAASSRCPDCVAHHGGDDESGESGSRMCECGPVKATIVSAEVEVPAAVDFRILRPVCGVLVVPRDVFRSGSVRGPPPSPARLQVWLC